MISEKQYKEAKETIRELNTHIHDDEEFIVKINEYKRKAEDNLDYQTVRKFEDIKRKMKHNIRDMKQSKKRLMFLIADYVEIDKSTVNPVSDKPLARVLLRSMFQVSKSFNGVSLKTIKDELPVKLSSNALNKVILEEFPEVESRPLTNDIKYNLEMI